MPKFKNICLILMLAAIMVPHVAEGAGLKIEKMSIYFENDRPEIAVKRNYPLKTYAEIEYTGDGLLVGHWEVDGEFLANVDMTVSSGYRLLIESPDIPKIPTFVFRDPQNKIGHYQPFAGYFISDCHILCHRR